MIINEIKKSHMEWVEQNVVEELINITSNAKLTTHESMFNSVVQD
jgi:hypothetical protein